jgi:Uri superfamily endonuclease
MQIHDRRPGTYALIFHCNRPHCARVGRLGNVFIATGYWIYVGSAFGPGGLRSRLAHHLSPSHRRHWHLDYIKAAMRPVEAWTTADTVKREHDWAVAVASIDGAKRPIPGFGASDCDCGTHLMHMPRLPDFKRFARLIHQAIDDHGPISRWKSG